MIVVVGSPTARRQEDGFTAAGLGASIARGARDAGAPVELIGKVGEGSVGDAVLLDVAAAGIGHVAVLRDVEAVVVEPDGLDETDAPIDRLAGLDGSADPVQSDLGNDLLGPVLDAGDLELALRYLPDYDVVVIAQAL